MSKGQVIALAVIACSLGVGSDAHADARFWANDIRTLFVIAKNIDRDEVQYGIHLDKDCAPIGAEPLYAYWRQLEQGPDVTEDLNVLDKTVYGIDKQWVTKRSPDENKVLMTLKATPTRGIAVITRKRDGKCVAESIATINGKPARLDRVFVHVPGFLRVDWIEIRGVDIASGQPAVERVNR
jgi:hypothetical protein